MSGAFALAVAVVLLGATPACTDETPSAAHTRTSETVPAGTAGSRSPRTERVSVDSAGRQANGPSVDAAVSGNGRMIAFTSTASNLVSGDTNRASDVFIRDLATGKTERVSVGSGGRQASGLSCCPSLSFDGRFVSFRSYAANLVPDDSNGVEDIFVRDRKTGATERVNVTTGGREANAGTAGHNLSADGRFVTFSSTATNLVPGDANRAMDAFLHDRGAGTTVRVSVGSGGTEGNSWSHSSSISAHGRYVAFRSFSSNLVRGDTNGIADLYVIDVQTGGVERVNVSSAGEEANGSTFRGSLSLDARFVSFRSRASNLVPGDTNSSLDAFVHNRRTGRTERVSVDSAGRQVRGFVNRPYMSGGGRFVIFRSVASRLVPRDTNGASDVYVHDRRTGRTIRVNVSSAGTQANRGSGRPAIDAAGRVVAFSSVATNLVRGDTNARSDVFVRFLRWRE
jgi:Tol biopolymer transport system component